MSDPIDPTKPTWTDPAPTTAGPTPVTPSPVAPVTPVTPSPTTVVAAPARRSSGTWVNVLLGLAVVVAVGGVAFAIGRSTAPTAAAGTVTFPGGGTGVFVGPGGSFDPGAFPRGSFEPGTGQGQNGFRGPGALLGAGGLAVDGTVQSIDGTTMTIKTATGETMTVTLDSSTTYHRATSASAADVAVGADVTVRVSGGRFGAGANGGGATTPGFTASDVTVTP